MSCLRLSRKNGVDLVVAIWRRRWNRGQARAGAGADEFTDVDRAGTGGRIPGSGAGVAFRMTVARDWPARNSSRLTRPFPWRRLWFGRIRGVVAHAARECRPVTAPKCKSGPGNGRFPFSQAAEPKHDFPQTDQPQFHGFSGSSSRKPDTRIRLAAGLRGRAADRGASSTRFSSATAVRAGWPTACATRPPQSSTNGPTTSHSPLRMGASCARPAWSRRRAGARGSDRAAPPEGHDTASHSPRRGQLRGRAGRSRHPAETLAGFSFAPRISSRPSRVISGRACAAARGRENGTRLHAVERLGYRGFLAETARAGFCRGGHQGPRAFPHPPAALCR